MSSTLPPVVLVEVVAGGIPGPQGLPGVPVVVNVAGATHQPTLEQANSHIRCTAPTCTITIPDDAMVAFPVNTILQYEQAGSTSLIFLAGGSAIINVPNTHLKETNVQFAMVGLRKVAANTWTLAGYLKEAG